MCTSVALAAPKGGAAPKAGATPKASAAAKYKLAAQLDDSGEYEKAIVTINEGLAAAPKDLKLLGLKGTVLLKMRDYSRALAAYQAYLDAGPTGANKREAEKIVKNLLAVESTFLDITLANGPADIYLDSKTQGLFCTAAPTCNRALLPGTYKVISERTGFDRWTGSVTVVTGQTAKLAITLAEKPSLVTGRVSPPGASITVDDKPFDAPGLVPAGNHRIVVSLAGHAAKRIDAAAHEGKAIEIDVVLAPVVPIRVAPPEATLLLDDKPIAIEDGNVAIPTGAHVLVARAPGFQDGRTEIPAERGADYQLAVDLARVVVVVVPPAPSRFTGRRKIALVVGGIGLVAVAGGTVLGRQAGQLEDDAYALCPSASMPCRDALEANDLNQRGRDRALQANIAYGVGGAAVVTAAILWLTGAPERRDARVAVTPRIGGVAGLDLSVRF